jgi:hypothetical protein
MENKDEVLAGLEVEGRNFIGIGKILIDTLAEDWNIPNLHFIVSKSGEEIYEAINLEFGLVFIGKSASDSASGLATLICTHILAVINGNGYIELRETARNNFMGEYWCAYRGIEFDLAETGEDLSHDIDKRINKAIQDSFTDELMKAIEQDAKQKAKELLNLFAIRPPVVEYKEVQKGRTAA